MIQIALLEKFDCQTFISCVEVRNMITDSNNSNKLRNVYIFKKHSKEHHHPKDFTISKSSNRAYQKFWKMEICKSKKGDSVSVVLALFNSSSSGQI